jgi:hypothetical protein
VRSPWRDRILSEIEEMVQGLKPDGVFLDIAGMPNALLAQCVKVSVR